MPLATYMENNMNIKIFCRSFDLKLYRLSKGLYESFGFPCVRLTDQTADGYFHAILRDTSCDVAVNVDEDCFITSREAVLSLVNYVLRHGYANAGCQDGGGWCPRGGNPLVTNPFFNVLDLRILRKQYSLEAVRSFNYEANKQSMQAGFPAERLVEGRAFSFDKTDFEPYYPFFLWQACATKTLYLRNERHPDGMTTILYNQDDEELCRHTWLARFYSTPAFIVRHWQPNAGAQQKRIDNVIAQAYAMQHLPVPAFTFRNRLEFVANKLLRWLIKIPQRIINWPNKLRKKLSK